MLNMALILCCLASNARGCARPLSDWGRVPGVTGPVAASVGGSRPGAAGGAASGTR